MKITYNKNPLRTAIELNDAEKKELWYKIKIEQLEDKLFEGYFYLQDENFNIERAKYTLNVNYDENDISDIDKRCDMLLQYYIDELTYSHSGDCTCVAASCGKCHAENLLSIDTIKGLSKYSANRIDVAFDNKNERTIDEALEYLKNDDCIPSDPARWDKVGGYEQYIPRWKSQTEQAYDWLLAYKNEHFRDG